MSMEVVAKRAGVGKAALYRRWPNKEAMIIALVEAIEIEIITADNCGSLGADIANYIEKALRLLKRPLSSRILPSLYSEMSRDTALADAIRRTIERKKRDSVTQLIDRAVGRGEVSDAVDRELVYDMLIGPLYWRAIISKQPIDEMEYPRLTAAAVVGAIQALDRAAAGSGRRAVSGRQIRVLS